MQNYQHFIGYRIFVNVVSTCGFSVLTE